MKCTECGSAMTKTTGDHLYTESGLDNVTLRNTTKYDCSKCGAKRVNILAMAQLHKAIAIALANKPSRLRSIEVKYLRDYLDLSNKDFAELMGVTEGQASRWTTTEQIGVPAERLLRMFVTLGPEVMAARAATTGEQKAVELHPELVLKVLAALRTATDEAARTTPIHVRREKDAWRSEVATSN